MNRLSPRIIQYTLEKIRHNLSLLKLQPLMR